MPKSVEAWGLMAPDGELLTFSAYEPDAFPKVLEALLELTPGTVGELMKDYTPIRVVITVKGDQE